MENNENNEVFTKKILKTLDKYKDNTTSIENHSTM